MADFKAKQKARSQAVVANQAVIKTLEKQRQKLSEEAVKHETELKLIDRELEDRKKLNEKIVSESSDFLAESESHSAARKALLQLYHNSAGVEAKPAAIEVDGYHLFKVN